MSYFKVIEKSFDSSDGGEDLRINSTKALAESVLADIRKALVTRRGLFYHRYLQSGEYIIEYWEKPVKTARDRHNNTLYYSLSGWHGGGKGNRNYGDSFTLFDIFGKSHKQRFELLSPTDTGQPKFNYFNSVIVKKRYIANLEKLRKAAISDKIDLLF